MDGITSKQILCIGLLSAVMLSSCTKPVLDRSILMMNWQPIDSLQTILPAGVVVFAGRNDSLPLRAWYVRIDESHPDVLTRVVVSDDATDNRETISSFANDLGACVVVNGGYFNMGQLPASHAGLLLVDTDLLAPATKIVMRDTLRYETARAALGFTENDEIEITWATTRNGSLYTWPNPPAHSPEQPAAPVDYDIADRWIVRDALGAGPMLLAQNELKITSDEEVFFGTSIPNIHPRTAAGRAEDGSLIIMVVDGRQDSSRGVSLEELALLMLDVGATDALNLDGGGSSTLVVRGVRLNQPAGDVVEREVMSALATFCN